jgi:AcrR family transcriptional regulator
MDSEGETGERRKYVTSAEAHPPADGCAGAAPLEEAGGQRAQIIAATMHLIARDGVPAVSTRKIAREAAVNLGTLHYRFGSKDDLLLAVLDAATSTMIGALVVDVHPGGGLSAALVESFAALSALLDQDPSLPLVRCEVLLYAGRRLVQAVHAFQQQQRFLDALQACYRVACAPGEQGLIAYDELAAVVSSSIDSLALQWAAGVPLTEQTATRGHVLRALLALVPPSSRTCGPVGVGTAGRPVSLRDEAIRSVRKE